MRLERRERAVGPVHEIAAPPEANDIGLRTVVRIVLCGILLHVFATGPSAETRYVRAGAAGLGNGASWKDAFPELGSALAACAAGDEVWVARGVYVPSATGDRFASFRVEPGVSLYGGFAGVESKLAQRDWIANPTVLSGDLAGDDGPSFANYSENSYHVVFIDEPNPGDRFDGFVIRGGNAEGPDEYSCGGGVFFEHKTATIANCTFEANFAVLGAGLYAEHGSPFVVNCSFIDNRAASGGAVSIIGDPTFASCKFEGNQAVRSGGAIYHYTGNLSLLNCEFRSNSAIEGGALYAYNIGLGLTRMDGCLFEYNVASAAGGAVYGSPLGSVAAIACRFFSNTAEFGGAIAVADQGRFDGVSCSFGGNVAAWSGGAVHLLRAVASLTNSSFSGNVALGPLSAGGGAVCLEMSTANITQGTFHRNRAAGVGGAVLSMAQSTASIANSILWANSDGLGSASAQFGVWGGSTASIRYSCVYKLNDDIVGSIDLDPLFRDPLGLDGIVGTPDDDLSLQAGSPCIDAGDNSAVPPDTFDLDEDGNTAEPLPYDLRWSFRFVDNPIVPDTGAGTPPIVDLGAIEWRPGEPLTLRDGDPFPSPIHGAPIDALQKGVDVLAPCGAEVQEVRVLVNVHRQQAGVIPDRIRVLRVADVVEDSLLGMVVGQVGPATARDSCRLEVRRPTLERTESLRNQLGDLAGGYSAASSEGLEVHVVIDVALVRERVVDL